MRVIAGQFRSRRLVAPPGDRTRPTSDRLRETIFNILGPRVSGSHFVDLYAGTGAVGIEALSRGASLVSFAEKARPALAALRSNLAALGITGGYTVEEKGAAALLQRLADAGGTRIDLLFLDPPYESEAEYTATMGFLGGPRGASILVPGALVMAEHSSKRLLPAGIGSLRQVRTLKQGDAALSFYAIPDPGPPGAG